LTDNSVAKQKRENQRQKEKEEDVAIQHAYIQMLDKQERDWAEEFKRREQRQKENQARMAENVTKIILEKQRKEDELIEQY